MGFNDFFDEPQFDFEKEKTEVYRQLRLSKVYVRSGTNII